MVLIPLFGEKLLVYHKVYHKGGSNDSLFSHVSEFASSSHWFVLLLTFVVIALAIIIALVLVLRHSTENVSSEIRIT